MTSLGWIRLISATNSGTLSASTWAVSMLLPSWAAMASHLLLVREARVIFVKISRRWAHLWVTTPPTPPAPIISTLLIWSFLLRLLCGKQHDTRPGKECKTGYLPVTKNYSPRYVYAWIVLSRSSRKWLLSSMEMRFEATPFSRLSRTFFRISLPSYWTYLRVC